MANFNMLRSYTLHRVAVAGLSFGAVLLGARLLPTGAFSALVSAAFLAKFLQMLNLGATAGYIVSRYSGEAPSHDYSDGGERRFLRHYLTQMYSLGGIIMVVATIWLTEYRFGVLAFMLLVPFFALEPMLRYRRNFSFSLAPEFLLSTALLAALAANFLGLSEKGLVWAYFASIAALGLILIAIATRRYKSLWSGEEGVFTLRDYTRVVIGGLPVYMGSTLFLVASSADRLLLPLYASKEQVAVYFLAYQLSVGAMIIVTAFNFVNAVDLGEARQNEPSLQKDLLAEKLRTATLAAIASYGAVVSGAFILETIFLGKSFGGLGLLVSLIAAGLALFFVSGSITPIVAYFHRQVPLTISMGLMAIALFANNAWVYWKGLEVIWLATGTAIALAAHSCFAAWFTFSVLRDELNTAKPIDVQR